MNVHIGFAGREGVLQSSGDGVLLGEGVSLDSQLERGRVVDDDIARRDEGDCGGAVDVRLGRVAGEPREGDSGYYGVGDGVENDFGGSRSSGAWHAWSGVERCLKAKGIGGHDDSKER